MIPVFAPLAGVMLVFYYAYKGLRWLVQESLKAEQKNRRRTR